MEHASSMGFHTEWSSGRRGSQKFATGIAAKSAKPQLFNEYAADRMKETAIALLAEQAEIADTFLDKRTGELIKHLHSSPFSIVRSAGTVRLDLNYHLKVRFLDLKKTATGVEKAIMVQLYNRLVWGYIYGRLYFQLRYGFTKTVQQTYFEQLREMYQDTVIWV